MKYPASHYPNSGIQHTRAIMALTATHACFHLLIPPKSITKEVYGIRKLTEECSRQPRKRKMSRGTERAINYANETLGPYIDKMVASEGRRHFNWWASLVWCALTLIEDVICTCPQYSNHPPIRTWDELHATTGITDKWCLLHKELSVFADTLMEMAPNMDHAGWAIYEEVFDAMEGNDCESEQWTFAFAEIQTLGLAA